MLRAAELITSPANQDIRAASEFQHKTKRLNECLQARFPCQKAQTGVQGYMTTSYDAIIVGGGHNGLTCGAYLAKAGLSTLVLERRYIIGGAGPRPKNSTPVFVPRLSVTSWATCTRR